ncbi:hypothetical protein M8818_005935 [Zalaria obscura]|uniref:Uncharacterized protein n=1 Tax=Zalaria obscura TaxID=2024903 RepID=A0ACC3S8A0_9PEZI
MTSRSSRAGNKICGTESGALTVDPGRFRLHRMHRYLIIDMVLLRLKICRGYRLKRLQAAGLSPKHHHVPPPHSISASHDTHALQLSPPYARSTTWLAVPTPMTTQYTCPS